MQDRQTWDDRYATEEFVFGKRVNAFLERCAPKFRPGMRVLAVADGEGRNGVWLAEQGLEVTSVDISPRGQEKARRLAEERGVAIDFRIADLGSWEWPQEAYDAVVGIFIQFAGPALRDRIFEGIRHALKPGGLVLIEGYRPEQLDYGTGGPRVLENLYTTAMLRDAFAGFEIVSLEAYDAAIEEGPGHSGMSALIDLVAQKPGG